MNIYYILFLLILTTFRQVSHAHIPSEGKVSATLAGMAEIGIETTAGVRRPVFGGAGLIVEGDISSNGGIELSLLYTTNQYALEKEGNLLVERVNRMYVPLGYRYWFSSKFSGGLGFFSAYKMGRVDEIFRSSSLSPLAKTSAYDTTEYGVDFSIGYDFKTSKKYAITFDARYSWPVTDKQFEEASQYLILIGLKYEVQRKEKPKKEQLR
ncbi:MAG: DUF3575 domain-containing protein [Pseudomonadota bacterium]|nr:DUF3575 domain-containing protein [Pseudomonadota bacterium]